MRWYTYLCKWGTSVGLLSSLDSGHFGSLGPVHAVPRVHAWYSIFTSFPLLHWGCGIFLLLVFCWGFYSNLFTVCPILSLKVLITFVWLQKFGIESTWSIITLLQPEEFLVLRMSIYVPFFHHEFLYAALPTGGHQDSSPSYAVAVLPGNPHCELSEQSAFEGVINTNPLCQ